MKKSVFVLFLLLVVSCTSPGKTSDKQVVTEFRSGTEGLSMSFMPNLPPSRLYGRDPFNVMLKLENKGTSTILPNFGTVYLSGFDTNIITGISTSGKEIPKLEGRSQYVSQGAVDMINFNGFINLEGLADKYTPTILATACYGYTTDVSAQVCIDPDPFSPTTVQKVCTPAAVATGSQGAPIAVSNIIVSPSPGKTRFEIVVQNSGSGNVFLVSSLEQCSPYSKGLSFSELDYVLIEDVSISGLDILQSCKPLSNSKLLRLNNGKASLFCELTNIKGNAYLTPLTMSLNYGYRQSISTKVEIRQS